MTEIDLDSMLNSVHVPEDAGKHEAGLRKIMSRIPDGWGRWISCDKGWYPLLIELDERLAEINPNYEIHQVKEKFGSLRFYIGIPSPEPQCCIDWDAKRPVLGSLDPKFLRSDQTRTIQEQYDLGQWYSDFVAHFEEEEHKTLYDALQPQRESNRLDYDRMEKIIDEYEDRSARTCEITGNAGVLMVRNHWYKTMDPAIAPEGYVEIPEEAADE